MSLTRLGIVSLSVILIFTVAVAVFHNQILWQMGSMLVDAEAPRRADLVVVLAGDFYGRRVLTGADLVRQGYAPQLFISNGDRFFGLDESKAAADFAVRHGYDRSTMICFNGLPRSTREEASMVGPRLREMGVHSVLRVTSPSHTARAARLFRRFAPGIEVHPVAAPDPRWCRGYWWTERECEKTWFLEETKTITGFFGV